MRRSMISLRSYNKAVVITRDDWEESRKTAVENGGAGFTKVIKKKEQPLMHRKESQNERFYNLPLRGTST